MHDTYGEVVRVGPDRLSYISPQACKDIYGHRTTKRLENPKDTRSYEPEFNGADHIINVSDVTKHGELRKIFTNAFSDRALKLQEPLINKYVDRLIENMHRMVKQRLDMVVLYNSTTFDIMGELAFGESLGLLESSEYSPWVKAVFANIKVGAFSQVGLEYPLLGKLIRLCMPRSILELQKTHFQHSVDRVNRRLEKGNDQPDIWNLVLQKAGNKLSLDEMYANSSIFMMAGTETTATLLSGLTYHLLKSPDKLRILTEEIRSLPEEELTLQNLPRLTYLSACFEEGLRCYPPVPVAPTREVAKGGNAICGQWIPEKTRVAVPNWAAYRSPLNFKDPESFIPERWLPGTGFDSDRKDVFQPFSSGPRNCLGKNLAYHEMRIILAKVLWHFDLQLCAESNNWADQKTYGLWEKPELWVQAKPRH
ncbi:Averantin hydroxylase [Lasiodiplodia hormozganensis]|uniref:Averantin hydroxylase n=1 Tax=Lasiodiplodia hormozganensis TaxID=869390 RepID=A0AA39Y840_9PEZI|nr:Averantin hydroxylase [Lasiodiplodia hormozganensis]